MSNIDVLQAGSLLALLMRSSVNEVYLQLSSLAVIYRLRWWVLELILVRSETSKNKFQVSTISK